VNFVSTYCLKCTSRKWQPLSSTSSFRQRKIRSLIESKCRLYHNPFPGQWDDKVSICVRRFLLNLYHVTLCNDVYLNLNHSPVLPPPACLLSQTSLHVCFLKLRRCDPALPVDFRDRCEFRPSRLALVAPRRLAVTLDRPGYQRRICPHWISVKSAATNLRPGPDSSWPCAFVTDEATKRPLAVWACYLEWEKSYCTLHHSPQELVRMGHPSKTSSNRWN
jgi:hypothetical protein